jgi:hypothetical protein
MDFAGTVAQGVVRFGRKQWDGDYKNIPLECQTLVSLRELGELGERIVCEVRESFKKYSIEIALKGGSDELKVRYGIVIAI